MDRRQFLKLMGTIAVLKTDRAAGLQDVTPGKMAPPGVAQPKESAERETGFMLPDLLASGAVPLGTLRSHSFYASLDDIESQNYLHFVSDRRNALVISAYVTKGRSDGALLRAVLKKLEAISPGDYKNLRGRFNNKNTPPVGVVLSFELKIPAKDRSLFPIDDLFVVTFERQNSGHETFDWVTDAFKIAEKQKTANLIVPCLGRQWTDKHTITFRDFFSGFLAKVLPSNGMLNVYFSLYSQWPSFELENAVKSLKEAWAKMV